MRQVPVAEPRAAWDLPVKERWFCPWCYAWTELGHNPREVSRPQYQPPHERWERADSPELPEDVAHAYDTAYACTDSGATLCGMVHDGLSVSPYFWLPDRDNACDACDACKETAAVIDRRWPPEMRDGNRVSPPSPPGSSWPPFQKSSPRVTPASAGARG
ncbi:hypothetical protein [Streptomyces prasinus]|uniref:hypothetical protein n=1 Tax=Streptomyces prasinus TaxID=67345 RepID=UPI003690ACE8